VSVELDHEVQAALDDWVRRGAPGARATPLSEARASYPETTGLFDPHPPEVGSTEELVVAGAAGPLRARLYVPSHPAPGGGLVLWLHGGGWIQGGIESHDRALRHLVELSGQRFLAVEYRLAPEHRFPAGLDDATTALRWTLEHADELGASSGRVAIGGDSAGASLALVAAVEVGHDQRRPALQILCYPSLGPELVTESQRDFDHRFGLTRDDMAYYYEQYLELEQDKADPRLSPLLSVDLKAAPRSIVTVAGFDPLRDEGFALVGLLQSSGVSVELLDETSLVHGYLCLGGLQAAHAALERLGKAISDELTR
jgi:acetyl esterase